MVNKCRNLRSVCDLTHHLKTLKRITLDIFWYLKSALFLVAAEPSYYIPGSLSAGLGG